MAQIRDMTKGSPARHIIAFSLPLLFGNMFQQLYSLVDAAVVGKAVGVEALAAVGSAGWLDWLVLGFVIGLTQGFAILISQRFGAGDIRGMKRAVAMSVYLSVAVMAVATTISLALCPHALRWMNTPGESYDLAVSYVRVIFLGIPVTLFYNLFAGMLRSVGDSRNPLIAMLIAAMLNIGLDLLFVAVFDMGVEGAALATVLGQLCSAVYCLIMVLRVPVLRLSRPDLRIHVPTLRSLARLGIPIASQNTIVSVGGVIMQGIVNSFGVIVMAGISAATKLSGLLEMAGNSISTAMHTYAGQNLGAGNYRRIREGVHKALIIAVSIAVVCGAAGILFGRQLLSMFVDMSSADAPMVIDAAYTFFRIICVMLFALYSMFIFRCTLQGMGDALNPIASSLIQVFMRTVVTYMLARIMDEMGVYIGDTLAWVSAGIFLLIVYTRRINRLDPKQS